MTELQNPLKQALRDGQLQIGLWCSLGSPVVTEVLSGSGFQWLLVDAEHSPNDTLSVLHQHQASSGYPTEIVVRIPNHDPNLIKQYLDLGIRSFLVPNVQTEDEARAIVSATRYPPYGIRGFSVAHRANRYGRVKNYHARADQEIFLALQIETELATRNAKAIAEVDGVDAIFVGPGDLSADMQALANPLDQRVQDAIRDVLALSSDGRVVTGILTANEDDARRYIEWGGRMVAVGSDLGLLTKAADALAARFAALQPATGALHRAGATTKAS